MECQIKCDCGRKIRLKKKNHSKLNEDIAPIGTNVSAKRSCAAAGIITHIDTSKTVWFQKLSETDRLRWTQSQLQKSFHKLANFGQPQIGFKAAVKINEVPYRVEVVEVNEDEGKVEVRMIDFGQIEQVNCTQLKMLPNQLARTKNLAHKGRLPDYCDINQLERSRFHRGLAVLPILSRLFQMCKREKLHPKLIWECKELTTQVRSASFSLLEPVGQIGSYPSAQVLQIFSPDKFYARFVKDYKKLRELQTQLESEYRQARPIANVDVSRLKLFVVLRSVDHKFYRAKLLEKASDTSAKVLLVDMGVEEMIEFSQVYTIADKFKNVRLIAFPVCLGPISSSGCNWSIEEISSFTEILKASDSLIYLPVKWRPVEPVFNHTVKSYAADPFVRVTPSDGVSFLKKISELMTKSGKLTVQLSG